MFKLLATAVIMVAIATSCTSASQTESSPISDRTITVTPIMSQTPSASSDEPILVFFTSEQGKFQVWLPVSGSIQEYSITLMFFGKSTECFMTASRLNSAGASAQYCDLDPKDVASLSDNTILEEVRNTLTKEFRLRVDQEQMELVEDVYPALSLSGRADMTAAGANDGTFKARIILVENRVYIIHMSVYHIDWCSCRHQMDQVIDSLYINPDLSIPFEPTP